MAPPRNKEKYRKILRALDEGKTWAEVVDGFSCSHGTISRAIEYTKKKNE